MSAPKAKAPSRRSPSQAWLTRARNRSDATPRYLAIAEAISSAVAEGELAPGDRLPPQRRVAEALGVDLTTVTRAYAHARMAGVLEGEVGRGTFVRGQASPTGPLVDLRMNIPPSPRDDHWRDLLMRGMGAVFRDSDPALIMTYRAEMGSRRDKRAAAAWLRPLLGSVDPERIFLAAGAQAALAALLPMLAKRGDTVLSEPWTYPGFLDLARSFGLKIAALDCDADGPRLAALEGQCKSLSPKALYLNPTLQNPTTRTISPARRDGIVAIARKYGVMILEDDAYGLLPAPIAPLATYSADQVIYISTLAKSLTPGLRTAFVVAPAAMSERIANALHAGFLMPTPLLSDIATRWIEGDVAQRLLASIRAESAARMKLARSILPARAQADPRGFHLWMAVPSGWEPKSYMAAARAQSVALVPSSDFAVDPDLPAHVRISLGAPSTHDDLARGLRALESLEG